ncbi:MAG: hypothetical protein KDD24_06370, partial [Flavobacteriales bacterium]|nr:hypothetical protein [Flavobacteriales bacterium]
MHRFSELSNILYDEKTDWPRKRTSNSATQNINDICFSNEGLLTDEFVNLYPALFEHSDNHIAVIRALGTKWKGLTRSEIINISK